MNTNIPFVIFKNRSRLPHISAIYFVLDSRDVVVYVGKARDLYRRWQQHHRAPQMRHDHRIFWHPVMEDRLSKAEDRARAVCSPLWNYRPVGNTSFLSPFRGTIDEAVVAIEQTDAAYIADARGTVAALDALIAAQTSGGEGNEDANS